MALAQRFNVNKQSVNGSASGTNLSLKDIVPIQPITKGTGADDEKVTVQQLQSIPYGTADLSGTTYTVSLINFPVDYSLTIGSKILVKFNTASGSSVLYLSINGTLVPMLMQGVNLTNIVANQIIEFTMIGTITNGTQTITGANASAGVTVSQLNEELSEYTKDSDTLSELDTTSSKPINSTSVNSALANYPSKSASGLLHTSSPLVEDIDSLARNQFFITSNNEYGISFILNTDWRTQIKYDRSGNDMKYRHYHNGTWTDWKDFISENDLTIGTNTYTENNTSYNSDYINTFTFTVFNQKGLLFVNISNLSFKQSGVNVENVITGLPQIKEDISIEISDWQGNTGFLRYLTNGTITMVWSSTSTNECIGNATVRLA